MGVGGVGWEELRQNWLEGEILVRRVICYLDPRLGRNLEEKQIGVFFLPLQPSGGQYKLYGTGATEIS